MAVRSRRALAGCVLLAAMAALLSCVAGPSPAPSGRGLDRLAVLAEAGEAAGAELRRVFLEHPLDGAVLPRDMATPLVLWTDESPLSGLWLVRLSFGGRAAPVWAASREERWEPPAALWDEIRSRAGLDPMEVAVFGLDASGSRLVSSGRAAMRVSADAVEAPIVYQTMPLPISVAAAHPRSFKWKLGRVSDPGGPRVILEDQPVCGMCHHFSADGRVFGLDLDVGGDKGAYVMHEMAPGSTPEVTLTPDDLISWTRFQDDGETTLGLFAKLSPDGGHVIATIQDKRVFISIDDPEYSEMFFAYRGVLACHDRREGRFFLLPGADDPDYVHLGAEWSPDGERIVFSRAPAGEGLERVMGDQPFIRAPKGRTIHDYNRELPFRYDLYVMPFDGGRGGRPTPLAGASGNGRSNYWPRHSPDGRFIVFTSSPNGLMNQPGSELRIVPAQGGAARRMRCNLPGHNSWHSFSPNGRWLVFASKASSPYTRLYLAHVDELGRSDPPVLLHRFNAPDRASVLPEFANIGPGDLHDIRVEYE